MECGDTVVGRDGTEHGTLTLTPTRHIQRQMLSGFVRRTVTTYALLLPPDVVWAAEYGFETDHTGPMYLTSTWNT